MKNIYICLPNEFISRSVSRIITGNRGDSSPCSSHMQSTLTPSVGAKGTKVILV